MPHFEIRNLLSLDAPIFGNLSISLTNTGLYLTIAGYLVFIIILLSNNNIILPNACPISLSPMDFLHKLWISLILSLTIIPLKFFWTLLGLSSFSIFISLCCTMFSFYFIFIYNNKKLPTFLGWLALLGIVLSIYISIQFLLHFINMHYLLMSMLPEIAAFLVGSYLSTEFMPINLAMTGKPMDPKVIFDPVPKEFIGGGGNTATSPQSTSANTAQIPSATGEEISQPHIARIYVRGEREGFTKRMAVALNTNKHEYLGQDLLRICKFLHENNLIRNSEQRVTFHDFDIHTGDPVHTMLLDVFSEDSPMCRNLGYRLRRYDISSITLWSPNKGGVRDSIIDELRRHKGP